MQTSNLLEDIDDLLAHLEDFTHGKDGDAITKMRYRIEQVLYGSKGSDDINPLTSNTFDYQNPSNMSDNFKKFSLYEHKETIATADTPKSSQTEISDDQIQKFIEENYKPNYIRIFVWEGIKWYREQLKKKQ